GIRFVEDRVSRRRRSSRIEAREGAVARGRSTQRRRISRADRDRMSESAPVGQAAAASRTSLRSESDSGLRRMTTRSLSRAKQAGAVSTQTLQLMHFRSMLQRYAI